MNVYLPIDCGYMPAIARSAEVIAGGLALFLGATPIGWFGAGMAFGGLILDLGVASWLCN
jgi:hypothetical protein